MTRTGSSGIGHPGAPGAGWRRTVLVLALVGAVGALGGAIGLITGGLSLGGAVQSRLPAHSPVLGGLALAVVVALPMTLAAWAEVTGRRSAAPLAGIAGALLVGWIAVEVVVIRTFSWLQPGLALLGIALGALGYRAWHLRWGATDAELAQWLPGDDEVVGAQFRATRAITIAAPPDRVWPWLMQVGRGRAGFYAFDRLDNGGRRSARVILPEFQDLHVGDVAAPMTPQSGELTAFRIHRIESGYRLLWSKADSTWSWQLTELPDGRTRLLTRLRVRYEWAEPRWALGSLLLIELADFPMMRRMLRGIRERAEQG